MFYADDSSAHKGRPVYTGCLQYFPAALSLVSVLSRLGNDKHNPGQPMHHARGKSTDHGDCIVRHQMGVGTIDPDNELDHAVAVAWRALAQLQELAERQYGWPVAPRARFDAPQTAAETQPPFPPTPECCVASDGTTLPVGWRVDADDKDTTAYSLFYDGPAGEQAFYAKPPRRLWFVRTDKRHGFTCRSTFAAALAAAPRPAVARKARKARA